MKDVRQIKIFIASPGDIVEELNSIAIIVDEINKTSGRQNNYSLQLLNWKTDTYTQVGEDVQAVINNQLETEYDILVGLMWQKIGTPTKRDKSGTIEEINRAISNNKKQKLIFFKTTSPDNLNNIDFESVTKVYQYKKELFNKGVLYKEFDNIDIFESIFRISLTNMIVDQFIETKQRGLEQVISNDNKYQSITSLIDEIESQDETLLDIDIFEMTEEATSYLNSVTVSLNSMTSSLNDLTENMGLKTTEINKVAHIKDEKLKMLKAKTIVNLLAKELDEFNIRIQNELPVFSENFLLVGNSYSKVILVASSYNEDTSELKSIMQGFRNSVANSTEGCASLIREMMSWPPVTSKFNKSKRETEVTLKDLMKQMLQGLLLLDEAVSE